MVLVFDLDGVLVRSTFFSDILVKMICERFEEQNILIEKPTIFQEILRRFIKKLGEEDKVHAYDWDLLIQEYLKEHDLGWTCEVEDFFNSDEILKFSYLYHDVEILEWLLEKGHYMAILTNGLYKYQDSVIEKLGLKKFFKRIIMPDSKNLRFIKPNPEIFKFATQGMPKPHIMIGDSLYFDIWGAKKVDYKTVWIHRRLPKNYRELSIEDRTKKINGNSKFLKKYIVRSAPFLKARFDQLDLNEFRPDYIISNLNELKELF